jgi:hypothetical protein
VADAVAVPAAAAVTVDVADVAEDPAAAVVADGIVADAAGQAGEDTRVFASDSIDKTGHGGSRGLFFL